MLRRALVTGLVVGTLAACAPKPHAQVAAPAGTWVSLFNGKDLSGWTVKIAGQDLNDNYQRTFRVADGLLKISYDGYDAFSGRFGSLYSQRKLSHYWLRAEYRFTGKLAPGAPSWAYENSGLQLHSQAPESMLKAQEFPVSVEFDIKGARLFGRNPTGDVCRNGTRVKLGGVPLAGQCSTLSDIAIPGDDWVTVLAEVDGSRRVRQIVNGALIVEYTDLTLDDTNADARRLIAAGADQALSSGYVSIQSNGPPIEFRRIEVLPLDDDAPAPARAAASAAASAAVPPAAPAAVPP